MRVDLEEQFFILIKEKSEENVYIIRSIICNIQILILFFIVKCIVFKLIYDYYIELVKVLMNIVLFVLLKVLVGIIGEVLFYVL